MNRLELRHAIERGNETGSAEIVLTGEQSRLPLLSFYENNGDIPKIECDLTIRLVGRVECVGSGPFIEIEGAAHQPYEVTVTGGGRIKGHHIFLRSIDLNGATFKNIRLHGFDVGFEAACLRTWHERCRYRDIMLRRCGTGFRFIDRQTFTDEHDLYGLNIDKSVKGQSFMRTRIRDIDIGGCKYPTVKASCFKQSGPVSVIAASMTSTATSLTTEGH